MKAKNLIIVVIILIVTICSSVYAADALYRFMHNDHDALVLGEIVHIDEKYISLRVEKRIISTKDLNANTPKEQHKLENVDILVPYEYSFNKIEGNSERIEPAVGDYALVSLEKT